MKPDWDHGTDAYADDLYDKGVILKFLTEAGKIGTLDRDDYLDGNIAKHADNWIGHYNDKEPLLLWVNFSAPHGPSDAPGKWIGSYRPGDAPPLIVDKDKSDIRG